MRSKWNLDPRRLLAPDFLIAAALFIFALALRAYGVRGSLPYVGHPDEPKLIDSAIHIVKTGDLNPNLYIWPSLYIYLEALVVKAQTVWGVVRGYYTGPESLPDVTHIYTQASGVYVWARTLTAVLGALTAPLLYVIGREMFNGSRRVGVVAALMLAVSPLHVEYSHYALTDVPLTLVGLLVLWASYRLSRTRPGGEGERSGLNAFFWPAVLCGLLVGIATGTKYNGLYVVFVPLATWLVLWLRYRRAAGRAFVAALVGMGAGATVGFILCEPYLILDWPSFYRGFTFQVGAYEPAENLGEMWASVVRHITDLSASDAYFFAPAALGAFVLLANAPVRNRSWLLIPFPLLYLLLMSRFSLTYVRNLLVTLPFLALMSGYVVDLAATQVTTMLRGSSFAVPRLEGRRLWGALRWLAVALVLVLLLAEPLRVSAAYSGYMHNPESRNLAWDWMQERMREGDRFAAELHPWQVQEWPDVLAFDVENPGSLDPLTQRPPEWYARRGYNYVVLSSNFRDEWRDDATWEAYRALPVARTFAGDKDGGKGPTITVLATGGESSPPMMYRAGSSGLYPAAAVIEDFARLEGYDTVPVTSTGVLVDPTELDITQPSEQTFKGGQAIGLNLYYRALRDGSPGDAGWQVWIHLVDPASGATVAQIDVPPLAGQLRNYPEVAQVPHPVSRWHRGELVAGVYNLAIPPGLPPGAYRLETAMWVPPSGPGAKVTYPPGKEPPAVQEGRIRLGELRIQSP